MCNREVPRQQDASAWLCIGLLVGVGLILCRRCFCVALALVRCRVDIESVLLRFRCGVGSVFIRRWFDVESILI